MIGRQSEDSCGKSGIGEATQKAKSCTEINSGVTSSPDCLSHLFVFSWGGFRYVSIFLDREEEAKSALFLGCFLLLLMRCMASRKKKKEKNRVKTACSGIR
ncbi:hypothetical protein [Priestia megaterium]|uniref:hypothetical protein n=1 Tax=Priestia megaterium TaxID=1404 RepID=UPI002E20EA4F|nr:hypothetical protein [Priestia megaterium]